MQPFKHDDGEPSMDNRRNHGYFRFTAGLFPLLFMAPCLLIAGCVSMKTYKELEYERDRALAGKRSAEESLRKSRESGRTEEIQYKSQLATIQAQEDEIALLKKELKELKDAETDTPDEPPPRSADIYYSRSEQAKGGSGLEINRETGGLVLNHDLLFQGSELKLQPRARAILSGLVKALTQPPLSEHIVYIDGHTNSTKVTIRKNLYPDNWALGARRASEVCHFLKTNGIEPARLVVRSYGYTIPLLPEDPENPANRRIEIIIGDTISSVR
jgi:flagellar motor protein MotB